LERGGVSEPPAAVEIGRLRSALVRIAEILEDEGRTDSEAYAFAAAAADEPREQRFRCHRCGRAFRWPGELDHHRQFTHFAEAA
jgi:hypothetical protein